MKLPSLFQEHKKELNERERDGLEERVVRLWSEGLTYREIAKQERISISQISRILNKSSTPKAASEESVPEGEEAAEAFELFEKGVSLPKVVIDLKANPDMVKALYEKWLDLKGVNVMEWIFRQVAMEDLLEQAKSLGGFRVENCAKVNAVGYCTNWKYEGNDGESYYKKANPLRCAYCDRFQRDK
jgi:transcriptional regulator with XRE-family HTH domain